MKISNSMLASIILNIVLALMFVITYTKFNNLIDKTTNIVNNTRPYIDKYDSLNTLFNSYDKAKLKRFTVECEAGVTIPASFPDRLIDSLVDHSKEYGIPIRILTRLIYCESRFDTNAHNNKSGADGLFQIMPSTKRYIIDKYKDRYLFDGYSYNSDWDIVCFILVSAYHKTRKFHPCIETNKDWKYALSIYNCGKAHGESKETINFVNFILQ